MRVSFNLAFLDGKQILDISVYADDISDILFRITDEENITIEKFGFTLYRMPTIEEILQIEQKLVALGLIIDTQFSLN